MKSASDYTPQEDGAVASAPPTATGPEVQAPGPKRINTLWGAQVRDHARMCIPDLNVLVDYPLDFRFPAFGWTKRGELTSLGVFFLLTQKVYIMENRLQLPLEDVTGACQAHDQFKFENLLLLIVL